MKREPQDFPAPKKTLENIIDEHLGQLGVGAGNRQELSRITRISTSQFSDWFNGKTEPSKDRVNQICSALAAAYESKRGNGPGQIKPTERVGAKILDAMLNEMLVATGFRAVMGAKQNQVWTRLSAEDGDKKLTVAYVVYPPFAYDNRNGRLSGIAIDIMQRVAMLMGVTPDFMRCEWSNVISAIVSGKADVVAPILLELPSRMFQVAFSIGIPLPMRSGNQTRTKEDLSIGISGLVNSNKSKFTLRPDKLRLNYVKGEAGEALCTMYAPEATNLLERETFERAVRAIEQNGDDEEGRTHCLVADHVICKREERASSGRLKAIPASAIGTEVKLPIAAAVHPEEPKLLQVLNRCMTILEVTNWYESFWKTESGVDLLNLLKDSTLDTVDKTSPKPEFKRSAVTTKRI